MRRRFIDRFDVLLLDMGLTFMFDADHFSDSEDYGATYRQMGGNALTDGAVYRMISALFEKLLADYTDPGLYDRYPSVVSRLKTIPEAKSFPETEIRLLERVFEMHEVGVIPTTHAEALHQLRETHRLGVVSNIWSRSDIHLQEFERAGVKHLFDIIIFSSDHGCIKPSPYLFARAMEAFDVARSKMVFVGDSLDHDIVGAKSVGLSAVWIDTGTYTLDRNHPRPDLVIHDLWDLLEI